MYMPVPTQRLMIFSDPMCPSLRVKCIVVNFGGGLAPRWLVAGARACANIPPLYPSRTSDTVAVRELLGYYP